MKTRTISKRCVFLSFILISCLFLTGCESLADKFIRKKKEEDPRIKRYYSVHKYDVRPSLELYTKRYVFWKNWHRELLDVLTHSNNKKKVVAIEQEISNLYDMQGMLVDEKAEGLQKYIDKLNQIEKDIKTEKITLGNEVRIRRNLEAIGRQIKKYYSYTKVRGYLRDEFRQEGDYST